MSDAPSTHKYRLMTWIVSMLAAALLYVASWPVVEIKASPYRDLGLAGPLRVTPHWLQNVYRPLHFLCDVRGSWNPAMSYYHWWTEILDDSAAWEN